MSKYRLDPTKYSCPQHGVNLTDEVRRAAIPDEGSVVVNDADSLHPEQSSDNSDWTPQGPFDVTVTCPGKAKGKKPAEPHDQPFAGEVQ